MDINTTTRMAASDHHIYLVRERVGKDWMQMGRLLGITCDEVDTIQIDYHAFGSREMAYQVLKLWRQRTGGQLDDLTKCLGKLGRPDIVRELLMDHGQSEVETSIAVRKITWEHKSHVSKHMTGENWRYLGEALGFDPKRLDSIQESSNTGVPQCCRKTLEEWISSGERNLGELTQALRKISCNQIAYEIEQINSS